MNHLYVHIPFCRSRCAYCDFASEPVGPHARAGRVEQYLDALRAELAERGGDATFETIYLGGGTPTVLPADALVALVQDLARRLKGRWRPVWRRRRPGRSGVHHRSQPRHHRRAAAGATGRGRGHAALPGGAVLFAGAARGAGPPGDAAGDLRRPRRRRPHRVA